MSQTNGQRRLGEHVQEETRHQLQRKRKSQLQNAIERANRELSRSNYYRVGCVLRDMVLPTMRKLEYIQPWSEYHRKFRDDEDYPWFWSDLKRFIDRSDQHLQRVAADASDPSVELVAAARGGQTGLSESQRVIERALVSLESVTSHHDITKHGMTNRADVEGFSLKLGEHLQDWDMDLGDPVKGVTTESGTLKTLFAGGTGNGKSTGAEREFEDFYQRNFREGRDYKCIDLAGIRDGENWFYDIPQKQEPLRDIREEQGLAPAFDEDDDLETPSIEILVPLTPGLNRQELPFDTESEAFTVQPFTVPASEIGKTVLISFIASRLSEGQEETVRSAYEAVDREHGDWGLRELAEEIKARDDLPPKNKATAINVIRSLQDRGFIRTQDHERTLDWERVLKDTETITVFSQALCEEAVAKFTTFSYLLSAIARERKNRDDLPQAAILMREFWKIAPHKRRQSGYAEVAALQESIAKMFSEVFRENRHMGLHIIADTQAPSDLHKTVREMFNRYVVYEATRDTVKDIFEWTINGKYDSFVETISERSGEAGIVGKVQPAVDNRHIEFLSPVQYVPPSHHHRISPGDDIGMTPDQTGWHARCKYLDREELRRPVDVDGVEWDSSLPSEMSIDAVERSDTAADVDAAPVAAFAAEALVEAGTGDYEMKRDIYDAFNEFLRRNKKDEWDFDEQSRVTMFGERLSSVMEDIKTANRGSERKKAYAGLSFSNFGQELCDAATIDVESSAAVIDDR